MTEGILDWLANLPFVTVLAIAVVLYALDTFVKRSPMVAGKPRKALAEIVESLLFAWVVVFLILKPFFMQAFFIPSESMVHTLEIHDRLLVGKLPFWWRGPQRGEILVFKAPPNAGVVGVQQDYIKRCMGLPGDRLEVRAGSLYINGQRLDEPYVNPDAPDGSGPDFGPIIVPPEHYFMMGDNRTRSADSRYWGPLDRTRIVGKAWFRFWPLNKIGFLPKPSYPIPEDPQPALGAPILVH